MLRQLLLHSFFLCGQLLCSGARPTSTFTDTRVTRDQLPLSTESRWIVDTSGSRVKLACVNWYGSDQLDFVVGGLQWQSISTISSLIASYGFNCVRLPFSLDLISKNPILANKTKVLMEPSLYNVSAMTAIDRVINTLTLNYSILVILDNHVSDANWCCNTNDGNGLWYTSTYSENEWLDLWVQMVSRYRDNPWVLGCDLRNELRQTTINGTTLSPSWGDNNLATDWRLASIKAANAVLQVNSDLLVFVEGIDYAFNLQGVYNFPILASDLGGNGNKLVYSAHDYPWDHSGGSANYGPLSQDLGQNWGFILEQNKTFTAPVWVGEFGTCHESTSSCLNSTWWASFREYLTNADIDWSWWAIDGTESTGDGRVYGSEESFGVLNTLWDAPASELLLSDLQAIIPATQGP